MFIFISKCFLVEDMLEGIFYKASNPSFLGKVISECKRKFDLYSFQIEDLTSDKAHEIYSSLSKKYSALPMQVPTGRMFSCPYCLAWERKEDFYLVHALLLLRTSNTTPLNCTIPLLSRLRKNGTSSPAFSSARTPCSSNFKLET